MRRTVSRLASRATTSISARLTPRSCALLLVVALAGCSPSGGDSPNTQPSALSSPDLIATIDDLCAEAKEQYEESGDAESIEELNEIAHETSEAENELLAEIEDLTAVEDVAEDFDDYITAFIAFNDSGEDILVEGGEPPAPEDLLAHADNGLDLAEEHENLGLSKDCPPFAAGNPYRSAFFSRASAICWDLEDEVNRIIKLTAKQPSRSDLLKAFNLAQEVSSQLEQRLRVAIPPELDFPTVDRLVTAYGRVAVAFSKLHAAFLSGDAAAYNQAATDQMRASREAERLARSIGLAPCVRIFGGRPR